MKNLLGYSAYMINGFFLHLIPALADVKPRHIKIEYDGNVLEDDFYFGSFSNSTSVAGLFKFDKDDVKLTTVSLSFCSCASSLIRLRRSTCSTE